jgi:osomolarity two-component system sensor histidine kinase SLN1
VNTTNYNLNLTEESLSVVAILKASQIVQAFLSLYFQVYWISTRDQIQLALSRYRAGNNTAENWNEVALFFNTTLGTFSAIGAVGIFDLEFQNVFNASNSTSIGDYSRLNPELLPLSVGSAPPAALTKLGGAISGPVFDEGKYLMSITLPVYGNSTVLVDKPDLSGYLTLVTSTDGFQKVVNDTTGLSAEGRMILAEAVNVSNMTEVGPNDQFRYLLPPTPPDQMREGLYNFSQYPALMLALVTNQSDALIDTRTTVSTDVAVGYATSFLMFTTWVVAVEEPHSNVYASIRNLRNIVIATAIGTAGFIVIITIPVAHFAVKPIYRLRTATEQTTMRFLDDKASSLGPRKSDGSGSADNNNNNTNNKLEEKQDNLDNENHMIPYGSGTSRFRVPMKVRKSRKCFRDELTDLTDTYNRMVDELVKQYLHLEDRVRDRTRESEAAKIQAESANAAKSLFIANITHELRTPLNGILGMTAVSLTETDTSKIRRSLKLIFKSGEVLLELLTDILTFSKNQVGHVALDEKEFCIADIISNLRTLYDVPANEKGIKLTYETSPPSLPSVVLYGDFSRILHIVTNLISNGLKFTKPGGEVRLRVRLIGNPRPQPPPRALVAPLSHIDMSSAEEIKRSLDEKSRKLFAKAVHRSRPPASGTGGASDGRGSEERRLSSESINTGSAVGSGQYVKAVESRDTLWCEFEVEDTGPGIDESLQQTVFEPFTQGDQALSKKFGGTGLGLSICRQLSDVLGGTITLRSKVAVGSTFIVRVPLRQQRIVSLSLSRSRETMGSETSLGSVMSDAEKEPKHKASSSKVGRPVPRSYFTIPKRTVAPKDSSEEPMVETSAASIRILIAEDNVINQEIIKRMLRLEGVKEIEWALDGEQVVAKVEEAIKGGVHYDLVFMDVQMPKMNGIDATKVIRGTLGYPYTIIALTAFADKDTESMCLDVGMNGILTKPIMRLALHDILLKFCPGIQLHEPVFTKAFDSPENVSPGTTA